jgi:asparagine synthase (glutamine-hydrolysing)
VCGICGVLALRDGGRPDPAELRAMNATLAHRGPDSGGELLDGPAGLAMRRLAIIDLEHGDQPIGSEDGSVQVVCNGEIVNHEQLRERLRARGHRFATRSDTEVLVHLYEERGDAFVDELRGMFALALWDGRRRRLLLARDRFGIKPLFYAQDAATLRFASELRALAAVPSFSRDLDPDALEAYLAFNAIPAPLSAYRAARKLPPGCVLAAEGGTVSIRRYARPGPPPADRVLREDDDELAARLLALLRDSVRAHLVSDVPVGVLLSGGVDSGVLTALAAEQSAGPVATFTVGFGERSFDEVAQARTVARRYGTDHHEVVLEPDAARLLPEVADAFDEPLGDSSALPTYLVSRLAADHVKVVLSGEGGDELFGGYHTYVAGLLGDRLGWAGPILRPVAAALPSSSRRVSLDYRLRRFAGGLGHPALERHHAFKEIFSADMRGELLDGRRGADPLARWRERYAETAGAEPLVRLQDVDLGIYLVDDLLVKTDRASMRHSLEARVPFLDAAVADFALALPRRLRVRGTHKKRLLRRVAATLLPDEIVRGPKRGFSIPAAAWLRGPLEPFARDVLSADALRRHGVFEPRAVERVIDRHVSRREDLSRQIWGLMAWTLWQDRRRPPTAPARTACESGST